MDGGAPGKFAMLGWTAGRGNSPTRQIDSRKDGGTILWNRQRQKHLQAPS